MAARRHEGADMSRTQTAIHVAVALVGAALIVRDTARQAERRNPPIGNFVEACGGRLHYLQAGTGEPAVVFIHGNGSMVEEFAASSLLDLVAQHHRVIVFDRPGFGHSLRPRGRTWTAPDQAGILLEACTNLGIERPIIVGHSWGTLVALAMALNHPERVSGLVLVSGYYYPTARTDVAMFAPVALPILGDIMRYTISPILGSLFLPKMIRKVFEPAPVPQRFKAEVPTSMMLRPSQIRASAQDTASMIPSAATLQARYGELRLPVGIIAGAGDRFVDPNQQAARLHQDVLGSTLSIVQGEGHMVHHGAAALIAMAIEAVAEEAKRGDTDLGTPALSEVVKAGRDVLRPDSLGG